MTDGAFLSIVIPVRDRWKCLRQCIGSLEESRNPPPFEVIVVDDGSEISPARKICEMEVRYPLVVITQCKLGISAARNHGINRAIGEVILFIDSDCRVHPDCLNRLARCIQSHPLDIAFQLRITGDNTLVGQMETLRLESTRQTLSTRDDYILYANTSGFAVRRTYLQGADLFDVHVARGEDSLLLQHLAATGNLPCSASEAIVMHAPPYNPMRYILRHFGIGRHTGKARRLIRDNGSVLMNRSAKRGVLSGMWEAARERPRHLRVFALCLLAYSLEVLGRAAYTLLGPRPHRVRVLANRIDPVEEAGLLATVLSRAAEKRRILITYATAWTLVQSRHSAAFRQAFEAFDLCYADGMGVVLAAFFTQLARLRKVTANDMVPALIQESARRQLKLALIGASDDIMRTAVLRIRQMAPDVQICYWHCGYIARADEHDVMEELRMASPDLVLLGMGQPTQEMLARRLCDHIPTSVIWCVGGLFDCIAGNGPHTPRWARKCGLEWLWRLAYSPGRCWRRYVIGLPQLATAILSDVAWSGLPRTFRIPSNPDGSRSTAIQEHQREA